MRIAFYKGTRPGIQGVYSRAVRWVDRGPYSHCELVFSDGLSASASYVDGGVRFKQIDYSLTPDHWDFIDLPDHLEAGARALCEKEVGQGYDLLGNLRFLFFMVRESKKDWFCNEICGASIGQTESWRHGPNGFYGYCNDLAKAYGLHTQEPATTPV